MNGSDVTNENYQKLANRTFNKLRTKVDDTVHMVLGIVGEVGEYNDAILNIDIKNQREELGDILWYIANSCEIWGLNYNKLLSCSIDTHLEYDKDLDMYNLVDFTKRSFAYGKKLDKRLLEDYLINTIRFVYNETYWRKGNEGFGMLNLMQINIDKLRIRFKDKFTTNEVLNRDLESEHKVL